MKLDMQKKTLLKILGENDKNIKLRKIWGVVLVFCTITMQLFWQVIAQPHLELVCDKGFKKIKTK